MSNATQHYWRSRRFAARRETERAARREARRYRKPKAPAMVRGWNELQAIANDAETVRVVREYLAAKVERKAA